MAQVINTNVMSLNAQRNLNRSQNSMATSLQRLSSGLRINSASDDAAGMAISERFTAQIRGLEVSKQNANNAISLVQTAEGALGEVANNLQRMRELAVQMSSAGLSSGDRSSIAGEMQTLGQEITRVSSATDFNGTKVIGSNTALVFQIGANAVASVNQISIAPKSADGASGATLAVSYAGVSSAGSALKAISAIDSSIDNINSIRSGLGAQQNRLESIIRNTANLSENLQASRSRVQDTDFAVETANLTRTQILQQAGSAMLSQANSVPQNVLSLLR